MHLRNARFELWNYKYLSSDMWFLIMMYKELDSTTHYLFTYPPVLSGITATNSFTRSLRAPNIEYAVL
jgi:hypothetical protein